jgi:hypothetical protein
MTPAETIFAEAEMNIFNALGVPVTYTPVTGTPVTIQALIVDSLQTQPSGMSSETWAQRRIAEFILADLPSGSPVPGDAVTDEAGAVYILEAPLENSGLLVKWVVK